jgi:polyisoprenoid-binding protein YceI
MKLRIWAATAAMLAITQTARPETYKIDNAHSTIGFSVHQFLSVTHGSFKRFSGTIEVDREHPEGSSVIARIQINSIDTGIRKRDQHLLSAEFFDAAKYPEIIFRSRSVKQTAAQTGDIEGDLTMHGITKPVVLHVKLVSPWPADSVPSHSHWQVTTDSLKRRDFNLMFNQTAETVSGISQEVAAKIDIEATAASQ